MRWLRRVLCRLDDTGRRRRLGDVVGGVRNVVRDGERVGAGMKAKEKQIPAG